MPDFNIGISYSDTTPRFTGATNNGLRPMPNIKSHHHHHHKHKSKLEEYGKPIAGGLILLAGIALLPEAVLATMGSIITGVTIGPIVEGATLDYLANSAFVQAATRAGAIVSSGKYLNIHSIFSKTKSTQIISNEIHPLSGWTVKQVLSKAEQLGLETPKDSLLLWSGLGSSGVKLSREFAEANGGMTLEMTRGGAWLDKMDLFGPNSPVSFSEAMLIWKRVSLLTVRNASGQVRAVIGQVSPKSIYNAELREILSNPKITGIDELQLRPRFVAGR